MNTFNTDLNRGLKVEKEVLKIARKKYKCATLIDAYKGYDLWIPEIHKSFEIKYDPMSHETGNFVIEIEMFNKPSALLTTTADYWILCDDATKIIMKPIDIIRCIFLNKLQYREFIGQGDTASKKAFLVNKNELFRFGKPLGENL